MARPSTANRSRRRSLAPLELTVYVAIMAAIVACFTVGFSAVGPALDAFWEWFDTGIERMRALGSLIPVAIALVAWMVYRSDRRWKHADRWWQRAEWALSTSVEDSPAKQHLGKRALLLLAESDMAPNDELEFFNELRREGSAKTMLDELARDLEAVPGRQPPPVPEGNIYRFVQIEHPDDAPPGGPPMRGSSGAVDAGDGEGR
jgi:hypothetical protein